MRKSTNHTKKYKEAKSKIQILDDNIKTFESTANIGQKSIKCPDCDFTTTTEISLKKHTKRMHSQVLRNEKAETYPFTCTLCDLTIKSKSEMKRHMKLHTYKGVDFKCEECDFLGINETTMEVHFGKEHSENIECGLCDFPAKDQADLDIHLSTCESYKCGACTFVTTTLTNMKTHIEKDHKGTFIAQIVHSKQNRTNKEEFDSHYYTKQDLFSMTN